MLIDSHVNLHSPRFDDDREAVIERARAAGVGLMVTISDKLASLPEIRAISDCNPDIWHTVGVHPHEAKDEAGLHSQHLVELANHPRVVGIGETGLDFHYDLSPGTFRPMSSAPISTPRARRDCRWWCMRARPTSRWRRCWRRGSPTDRSSC